MRDMAKAVRQALIETLGEQAPLPRGLDEVQERVSERRFVGGRTPFRRDKLRSDEWSFRHI
jgi:hypothetical protein